MAKDRIFLTGGTGNVGRPVLRELLTRGYDVTVLVRKATNLAGCRTVIGELANMEYVMDEAGDASGIIHLANSRRNERFPVILEDICGTSTLLEAWRKGNFVFASSQTVYGTPGHDLTEDSQIKPECWYDFGKVCNELQVQMVARRGDFERSCGINLRLALVFCTGGRNGENYLAYLYERCMNKAMFVFESERGIETFGSVFVGEHDLARAIVDSLHLQRPGTYNVSSGFCTWRSLIELICKRIGVVPRFKVQVNRELNEGDCRLPQSRSFFDTTKFRTDMGFTSDESLEELVERFVAAESRHGA